MSNKNIVKTIIHNYFIIFACCISFIVLLNPTYDGFTAKSLRYVMLCSFVASLPNLILYFPRECSVRYAKIRIFLHFTIVELVVLIFATVLKWAPDIKAKILMIFEVAVIYVIVKGFSYREDKKTADQINEKLRVMRQQEKES